MTPSFLFNPDLSLTSRLCLFGLSAQMPIRATQTTHVPNCSYCCSKLVPPQPLPHPISATGNSTLQLCHMTTFESSLTPLSLIPYPVSQHITRTPSFIILSLVYDLRYPVSHPGHSNSPESGVSLLPSLQMLLSQRIRITASKQRSGHLSS